MSKWHWFLPLVAALVFAACTVNQPAIPTATPKVRGPALKPWPGTRSGEAAVVNKPLSLLAGDESGSLAMDSAATLLPPEQRPTPAGDNSQSTSSVAPAGDPMDLENSAQMSGPASPVAIGTPTPSSRSDQISVGWETAASAVPDDLVLMADIVTISGNLAPGSGAPVVPLPDNGGAVQSLDLYAWDGRTWSFVPSVLVQQGLQPGGPLEPAVQGLAIMQVDPTEPRLIGIWKPTEAVPAGVAETIAGALIVHPDGTVSGEARPLSQDRRVKLAYAACAAKAETAGSGPQAALPIEGAAQRLAIEALVERLATSGFEGLNLDCPLEDEGALDFVAALAGQLHKNNSILSLSLPLEDSAGEIDRWLIAGRTADLVYLKMPPDPRLYAPGGWVESRLSEVVRRIDRRKLMLVIDTLAYEAMASQGSPVSDEEAWATLVSESKIRLVASAASGDDVNARLVGPVTSLSWDADAAAYGFAHDHEGQNCEVWLAGEDKLQQRAALANRFRVRGLAAMDSPQHSGALEQILTTLQEMHGTADAIPALELVWSVTDETGNEVARRGAGSHSFLWQAGPASGDYWLRAVLNLGHKTVTLGEAKITINEAAAPATSEPAPQGTATPATPTPESTPRAAPVRAMAKESSLLHDGPGLAFSQIGQLQAGQVVTLTGRSASSNWLRTPGADGGDSWVLAVQMEPQAGESVWDLPQIEYEAPSITPATLDDFSLGGQTHYLFRPNLMVGSRMGWVKFQHKWTPDEEPAVVSERIREAHANGLHVLLSITGKDLYPNSIEFDSLITFLGGVAGLGPDAIEIWNEANLDREWPAGQISPADYVQEMLAPAYQAIKASNPEVLVISGALAPTGVDDGVHVWADDRYLAGMAAAGAANYVDCIGVHHNAGATSPYALSGHPGGDHYSWYFWPTLRLYHDTFDGQRPVCFTELGYLTSAGFDALPAGFSWAAGTSLEEHAQWLAEAIDLAKLTGQVGLVIVFNVDFTHWDNDPQAGYAILRPDGSCPACSTLATVMDSG